MPTKTPQFIEPVLASKKNLSDLQHFASKRLNNMETNSYKIDDFNYGSKKSQRKGSCFYGADHQTAIAFDTTQSFGKGNFGSIYVGWNFSLQKPCAIKVMLANTAAYNEISNLKKVGMYYDYTTNSNKIYVACEFLYGLTLKQLLTDYPVLSLTTRLDIAIKLLEALQKIIGKGLLHGDIKLDNIIYDKKTQTVKFCDYGLSQPTSPSPKKRPPFSGTPKYIAPEILFARRKRRLAWKTEKSEVYASGVCLLFLFANKKPEKVDTDTVHDGGYLGGELNNAYVNYIDKLTKQTEPDSILSRVFELIKSILDTGPSARPSLLTCIELLKTIQEKQLDLDETPMNSIPQSLFEKLSITSSQINLTI